MGDNIVEAQISDLTEAGRKTLLEVYEVLRMAPEAGQRLAPTGNMYTLEHSGLLVTYFVMEDTEEIAVLRVAPLPF